MRRKRHRGARASAGSATPQATTSADSGEPYVPKGYRLDAKTNKLFKLKPGESATRPPVASPPPCTLPLPAHEGLLAQLWRRECYGHARLLGPALIRAQRPLRTVGPLPGSDAAVGTHTCFAVRSQSDYVALGSQGGVTVLNRTRVQAGLALRAQVFGPATATSWHARHDGVLLVTQFGQQRSGRVVVARVDDADDSVLRLPQWSRHPRQNGSLWCVGWLGDADDACVAGGTRAAHLLHGIGQLGGSVRLLWSDKSDVFAVASDARGDTVFHGARDGLVRTVDVRAPSGSRAPRGSHAPPMRVAGSVSHIAVERGECSLLVASHAGVVERHDRRMLRALPLCSWTVPNHSPLQPLALAVGGRDDVRAPLFATGSSGGRVLLWSARGDAQSVRAPLCTVRDADQSRIVALAFDAATRAPADAAGALLVQSEQQLCLYS
eukprot:TRINITY_DN5792_c0_g1_i1.p1 TRINITY_DN5792_c0_g1~~TRINITY_DN5792_c0_g1_i1.p1  ORF type:complete len:437 (-),score=194.90 TRINITY_DN5792_c0_g1_i1:676-1986(-)